MNPLLIRKALLPVLLCTVSTLLTAQSKHIPVVANGVIDLRDWNLYEHRIALTGHWLFFNNQLLTRPGNAAEKKFFPAPLKTDQQFGTYALTLLLPSGTEKLALEIPQLYSSYTLLINDNVIAANGKPGTSKETTLPQWHPQLVTVDHPHDTLTLVLQIANFHHYYAGAKQPVYVGSFSLLERQHTIASRSNLAECMVLLMLGFSFFIIYYVQQEKKKITLYFSLLCISWAIRSVFSNNYLIMDYFPNFDWHWMIRIEYIMLYSMLIWTVLFFSRVFPQESSKIIKYIFVGINCLFIAETLVMPPAFFTHWISLYLLVAALVLIHSAVITVRALVKERAGAWYFVFSLVLGLIMFTYDIFVFEGYFQHYDAFLFSIGYIMIFTLMAVALFYHLKIFKGDGTSGTLTFDDLYGTESVQKRN